ncbi:deoxyuridine 5'-triphosphate nucleotidohydrolase [Brevibacillus sp. AG]|uniref:dUTP diphosphatase n=1 Tax=Brevibacillus sp. AG TaxID=3020891 RepID=UPI0023304C5A|nr:deoxyuridine 5'-triphosphate nucleotidohydrolase [Brevibacillus sp. AG]MDC0763508.1 deoxyuridine 5'-triphosphate nucleotidohydrolase [Brevibacillus sp. AG]
MSQPEVTVKLKKVHSDAILPTYANPLDAGFDLRAIEDVVISPGQTVKVPTGIAIALPHGREVQVRPRSGVSEKTKLRVSNAPGTCDAGFRGEICVLVDNIAQLMPSRVVDGEIKFATGPLLGIDGKPTEYRPAGNEDETFYERTYVIRKGERIAQGVLAIVKQAAFEEVDELDKTERGEDGFGSSGTQ